MSNNKNVDYNNYAKTFSNSRKNMKWEELDYFLDYISDIDNLKILDVWCWNWRLLKHLIDKNIKINKYLWVDLSEWLLSEARKIHDSYDFLELDMLKLDSINEKFNIIFFVASFHHLSCVEDRLLVLKEVYNLLEKWWLVLMTNWALNSSLNYNKYLKSIIPESRNSFWSIDYNIKIWEYDRYYHCFDLTELDFLVKNTWFKIIENKLFWNKKNLITILKKT